MHGTTRLAGDDDRVSPGMPDTPPPVFRSRIIAGVDVASASGTHAMPFPDRNPDLHGNVPDSGDVALLIVDVLNALDFEGSSSFVPKALEAGRRIAALKRRAADLGIPVVYVNDNSGRWRSDLNRLLTDCTRQDAPGRELATLLAPAREDYVVLKPKHSGFYSTTLDTLLTYLRARTLVLTGLTIERCLLFTANDAFLRDYELYVPSDCTAAIEDRDQEAALRILERVLSADTTPSTELALEQLRATDA
jgi:nicotinamidase-related amidase